MTQGRRIRFGVLLASAMCAILSTPALASDPVTRVLTTAELPESIAIDHKGATYISFPFASEVVKFAPGGSLSTVATFPSFPLGVRLDDAGDGRLGFSGEGRYRAVERFGVRPPRQSLRLRLGRRDDLAPRQAWRFRDLVRQFVA